MHGVSAAENSAAEKLVNDSINWLNSKKFPSKEGRLASLQRPSKYSFMGKLQKLKDHSDEFLFGPVDMLSYNNACVVRWRPICAIGRLRSAIGRLRCAIGGSADSAAIGRVRNDRSIAQRSVDRADGRHTPNNYMNEWTFIPGSVAHNTHMNTQTNSIY